MPGWIVGSNQGGARRHGYGPSQSGAAAEALEERPRTGEAAVGADVPPTKGVHTRENCVVKSIVGHNGS